MWKVGEVQPVRVLGVDGYPYGFNITNESGRTLVSFSYSTRARSGRSRRTRSGSNRGSGRGSSTPAVYVSQDAGFRAGAVQRLLDRSSSASRFTAARSGYSL